MTIDNFASFLFTLAFVVPGFIFVSVTRRLSPQSSESNQVLFLKYITYSSLSYLLASYLFFWIIQSRYYEYHPLRMLAIWSVFIFICPLALGIFWSAIARSEIAQEFLNNINLNVIHSTPTSWDYKFFNINRDAWLLVTLIDGSTVAGYWGSQSFASSDQTERDLYIEEVYEVCGIEPWIPVKGSKRSIWIRGDQIKYITFFNNEEKNGIEG